MSTASASYTRTAKILHWLIAAAIIFMLALGWGMDLFPKGEIRFFFIQLHKSIGISILLLSLVRLGWRIMHHAPPLPASMPVWEQRAAHFGHILLYVVMISMPLTGWAMVSASPRNIPTVLFGLVPWPHMPVLPSLENKKEVSQAFSEMHGAVAWVLAVLVGGHAAAALKHHFISRDATLMRMAPICCARFLERLRARK